MTAKEIEKTLNMLHFIIREKRHSFLDDKKIRVRMGRELAAWINGYNRDLIMNIADSTIQKTIFGYPLEINLENPMGLEVLIVENVPIYKEEQPQESSC